MDQLKETLREVLREELAPIREEQALIKAQLDRMETAQQEDIVTVLQMIDKKVTTYSERHEHQIRALNDRLFTVEADVRKLLAT